MAPTPPTDSIRGARLPRARTFWCCCVCFAAALQPARAQVSAKQLTELSLEELMQVEVTTVSKHAEKLTAAPAAVFTLSGDDLRRAGAAELPDALRLVPGVQVGQVDAHDWAISARGFSEVFATKLLVLRDGRTLYTPLFSGVFWDVQDTLLDDLDRIEIVRGPGATLWGANAVNGVINIISKPAAETQGTLVRVAGGTEPQAQGAIRYGGAIDPHTHFRVYAKATQHAPSELEGGADAHDRANLELAGFRLDHGGASGQLLTLEGETYAGREQQVFYIPEPGYPFVGMLPGNITVSGAHVLGRWTTHTARGDEWMAQSYVDYTNRETPVFDDLRRIFDAELQGRLLVGERQELTIGGGFRVNTDGVRNTSYIALNPSRRQDNVASAFVQDDIEIVPHRVHFVPGTKLEHNAYTGVEFQPGARVLFTPNPKHTFWFSVARAVRTPSRADEDILLHQITTTPGVAITVHGSHEADSEVLRAYEAGYRFQARDKISLDVALFYNDYPDLRSTELGASSLPILARLTHPGFAAPILPVSLDLHAADLLHGATHGGEIALNLQPAAGWRLRTTFSLLRMNLHSQPGSTDFSTAAATAGGNPQHQATLWSQHDFGRWHVDWMLRYVDRIPAIGVPSYVEGDVRLAFQPMPSWEIALVGHNLLHASHLEYVSSYVITQPTRVPRTLFLELRHGY